MQHRICEWSLQRVLLFLCVGFGHETVLGLLIFCVSYSLRWCSFVVYFLADSVKEIWCSNWWWYVWEEKILKQEWVLAFQNKIQSHERLERVLFIRTKHNMHIFRVTPFFKLQNKNVICLIFVLPPLSCFKETRFQPASAVGGNDQGRQPLVDDPDVWRVTHLWRFPDDGPKVDGFAGHNGCFPCHRHPETADWRWHWICEKGDMIFVLFLNLFEVTQTLSVSVVVSVSVVLSVCLCPPLSLLSWGETGWLTGC